MSNNIFENATREIYKFPTPKGDIDVIDLWDLKRPALNQVYKTLKAQVKSSQEDSLEDERSVEDTVLDEKIEIVKYIHGVYKAEAQAKTNEKAIAEENRRIDEIIARKEQAELENMSIDDLRKLKK
jgi:hypothetical protein